MELEKSLKDFFDGDVFCEWMIREGAELPVTVGTEDGEEQNFLQHGEKVVSTLNEQGGIEAVKEFEVSWRQHFLDAMKPQYMPDGWNLYHNHERIEEKLGRERRKEDERCESGGE